MSQIQNVTLSRIRTEGLQVRAEFSHEHADNLAELFGEDGVWPSSLPPVVVFFDGTDYHLADGHHRCQAARDSGCVEAPCDVRQGDKTAALWCALQANASHGLPRNNADKRRAVLLAYQMNPLLSDNAIAKHCRVSQPFVSYFLKEHRKTASTHKVFKAEQQTPAETQVPEADGGSWYAWGETAESICTPWDAEPDAEESQAPAEPIPSAAPAPSVKTACPSPASTTPAAAAEREPDVRIDSRGRKMDVSRIGKRRQAKASSADGTAAPPVDQVDALGIALSAEAAEAFAINEEVAAVEKLMQETQRRINALASRPGAELYRSQHLKVSQRTTDGETVEHFHCPDLTNAVKELRHWKPWASVCPHCRGTPQPTCGVCWGLNFVTRTAFERCPDKLKQSVLAMAPRPDAASAD